MRIIWRIVMCMCFAAPVCAQEPVRPETTSEVVERETEWHNLVAQAFLLMKADRLEDAEAVSRKVAMQAEAYFGEDNPRTAQALNDWGFVLRKLGRYSEAEALHRRSLEIRSRHLKAVHPWVIQSKSNLAKDLFFQDEYDASRALFEELRRDITETQGPGSFPEAAYLIFLGRIADAQSRNEAAGEHYTLAFEIITRDLPDSDERLIEAAELYADWLRREHRGAEAEAIEARYLRGNETGSSGAGLR